MAKRTETLDDLFDALATSETWEKFAERAGVASRTIWRMRRGIGERTNRSTIAAIAAALGVEPNRVRAAIEASRAAAKE